MNNHLLYFFKLSLKDNNVKLLEQSFNIIKGLSGKDQVITVENLFNHPREIRKSSLNKILYSRLANSAIVWCYYKDKGDIKKIKVILKRN